MTHRHEVESSNATCNVCGRRDHGPSRVVWYIIAEPELGYAVTPTAWRYEMVCDGFNMRGRFVRA